jgi:hypothetical protein
VTFHDWALKEHRAQVVLSRDAGMTGARAFHDGIVTALLVVLGDGQAATKLADLMLSTGARGSRGLAGLREGFAMIEGVRSYIRAQDDVTAAAWGSQSEGGG